VPAIYLMYDGSGHWPVAWRASTPPKNTFRWRWHYLGLIEEEDAAALLQALHDRPGLRREVAQAYPASAAGAPDGASPPGVPLRGSDCSCLRTPRSADEEITLGDVGEGDRSPRARGGGLAGTPPPSHPSAIV
jgi:hypothetical protein